jgi:hypothetical protein
MEQVGAVVTLQTCIREILSSNLGQDTRYPDRCFSQSLQANDGILLRLDYDRFLPHTSQLFNNFTIRLFKVKEIDKIIK